jgi:phage baseplate assembly protein W
MTSEPKSFLGTGWSFPPTFDTETNEMNLAHDEDDIRQSLFIILSTTPGERAMNPEFGCNLQSVVFKNIDSATKHQLKSMIESAVLFYEPRITLGEIEIDDSKAIDGVVNIELTYTVRKINKRSNIVYPFYINEGTSVSNM